MLEKDRITNQIARTLFLAVLLFALLFILPMPALAAADTPADFLRFAVRGGVTNAATVSPISFQAAASESGTGGDNLNLNSNIVQDAVPATINTDTASEGYIYIAFSNGSVLKARVLANGREAIYDMHNDGTLTNIPLTLGTGEYKVQILQNVSDNRYANVASQTFYYSDNGDNKKYLQSIPTIEFNSGMQAIQKAAELCAPYGDDRSRVGAIYDYIVSNVAYDSAKAASVSSGGGYISSIENTYLTGQGICYDYASMFAGMCRSQGIPCKLVKGLVSEVNGYHAWNEVFVNGGWQVVDTSSDSVRIGYGQTVSMFKGGGYVQSVTEEY